MKLLMEFIVIIKGDIRYILHILMSLLVSQSVGVGDDSTKREIIELTLDIRFHFETN